MRSGLFSRPRGAVLTVLMAMLALVFAACGGGSSTPGGVGVVGTDTPVPPAATAPAAAATNTPAAPAGAATINMATTSFSGTTTVTIKAGQSVTFDDTNGGTHNLVTGSNGTFSQEAGAPSEFSSSGTLFHPGDTKTIVFPTAGTYHITCTFHPTMEATVTVTA
ncbi:MAG TPA: plastocyanin/azurin family copper-binding protein [Ktedonobacterales bacterium]|nr:plastocyanin/azurin family copper-binding protein [Ktedonobacterales bacterium]